MSKRKEMQRFIRRYKDETGETEIDMHKVAEYAKGKGWPLPTPPSPLELLAKQFTQAASEEIGHNPKTGKPFRVYHAIPAGNGQLNLFYYVDIADATRNRMLKAAVIRREQMIRDGLQLTLDLDHWNSINKDKEPIELPMDLTLDIEIAKNADDDEKAA